MDEQIADDDASRPGIADSHLHLIRTWYLECRPDNELQPILQDIARIPWLQSVNRVTEKQIRKFIRDGSRTHRLVTGRFRISLNEANMYSPYGRKQPDGVFDVIELPDGTEPIVSERLYVIESIEKVLINAALRSAENLIKAATEGDSIEGDEVWVPINPGRRPAKCVGEPLVYTRTTLGNLEFGFYLNYVPEDQ